MRIPRRTLEVPSPEHLGALNQDAFSVLSDLAVEHGYRFAGSFFLDGYISPEYARFNNKKWADRKIGPDASVYEQAHRALNPMLMLTEQWFSDLDGEGVEFSIACKSVAPNDTAISPAWHFDTPPHKKRASVQRKIAISSQGLPTRFAHGTLRGEAKKLYESILTKESRIRLRDIMPELLEAGDLEICDRPQDRDIVGFIATDHPHQPMVNPFDHDVQRTFVRLEKNGRILR